MRLSAWRLQLKVDKNEVVYGVSINLTGNSRSYGLTYLISGTALVVFIIAVG